MDYQLSIVTPRGKIFDEQISALTAPGALGAFGILGQHAPMVAALKNGVLKITKAGNEMFYGISAGILEVNNGHDVLILSDKVTPSRDAQEAKLQADEYENN